MAEQSRYREQVQTLERLRHNARTGSGQSWHGMAFIVEAVVLLAFLVASITIFFQLFAQSKNIGVENEKLSGAIVLATNMAEEFAVHPVSTESVTRTEDGLMGSISVTQEETGGGVLYRAVITVTDASNDAGAAAASVADGTSSSAGEVIYTIETASYEANDYVPEDTSDEDIAAEGDAGSADDDEDGAEEEAALARESGPALSDSEGEVE